ncbi:hypothetical protein F5J12DRAFT_722586, partial [Pisolithus orientalis]|uniref:uncharacterized protein n=1 Tax=Pisolithus orientalis TaxID=936130 RepID=UPI0022253D3F
VCSCCHKTNYSQTDFDNWMAGDKDKLHQYAEEWRDAHMSSAHDRIFKDYGVCYSELWHLPYWDPTCQLIIDSMHCILEGLVQHHVCSLLGLTTETSSTVHSIIPAFHYEFKLVVPGTPKALSMTTKEITQVLALHKLLVSLVPSYDDNKAVESFMIDLWESLVHKNACPLKFVCQSLGCVPSKSGKIVPDLTTCPAADAMYTPWLQMPLSALQHQPGKFTKSDLLDQVCKVIHDIVTPSWLGSVPSNFGDVSTGTIKADQWHSLIKVYLPLALINLWGTSNNCSNDGTDHKAVLNHTMDLISAVNLACAWTMSTL